eukprot:TRINITY_DN947_c0_g3_i1.p1 TRINITY_DN947_c0_g3~~TRINITY_DN947_c0_g3_i1.p1  ORF type:complete len:598 (+),score=145.12 TRINITY_DN947_c0_g3_i1:97-1890(+)
MTEVHVWGDFLFENSGIWNIPQKKRFFDERRVVDVAASARHFVAVTADGDVYCAGENSSGQCGTGGFREVTAMQPVKSLSLVRAVHMGEYRFIAVEAGAECSCALSASGDVYLWGLLCPGMDVLLQPNIIYNGGGDPAVKISCGDQHLAIITKNGRLFVIGLGRRGRLGLGDTKNAHTPSQVVVGDVKFANVSCGPAHTLCISDDGRVYGFGRNNDAQLGLGASNREHQLLPVEVEIPGKPRIRSVLAGFLSSFFVDEDGNVFKCGANFDNELGFEVPEVIGTPQIVTWFAERNIRVDHVKMSQHHTLFITRDRRVFVCGKDASRGLLGLGGGIEVQRDPEEISIRSEGFVHSIVCNANFCAAVLVVDVHVLEEAAVKHLTTTKETKKKWMCCFGRQWMPTEGGPGLNPEEYWRDAALHYPACVFNPKIRKQWYGGAGSTARKYMWPAMLGNRMHITSALFDILVTNAMDDGGSIAGIELDLGRTMAALKMFHRGGPFHDSMKEILGAFAQFRPDLGYIQGMSYISGILLLHMSPFKSFRALVHLLHRPFIFHTYSNDGYVSQYITLLTKMLEENLPDLAKHFRRVGLTLDQVWFPW